MGGHINTINPLNNKAAKKYRSVVKRALKEDIGRGDITADAIVRPEQRALAVIHAKDDGIVCGIHIARMVFEELDADIDFQIELNEGAVLSPGVTIATINGSAAACLTGERTALNILQHLSGIATLTRHFVMATEGKIKILDTRKTLPGLRLMEKYAVRTGGGHNHRLGLYDMVLIKNNHIQIAGSITAAVQAVRRKRKKQIFIEVEVKTFDELREAVTLDVNRIMLDNMTPKQISEAVKLIRARSPFPEIEISGGITIANIPEYADCGADYVSVGALTHSAPAIDIAMKCRLLG